MIVSEARISANRANALRSTGPRTDERKARSRANSLQHGMTGAGVVLPDGDPAEVERRFTAFRSELAPRGEIQTALVRRAALLSVRLDRSADHEAAAISSRVRHAEADFDEAREDEADALMATLADDPAIAVRKLRRMPEGVNRLVAAWSDLRADLLRPGGVRWSTAHQQRAENLSGRDGLGFGSSRIEALSRAIRGDHSLLGPEEGTGLDDRSRSAWARERMAERIDAEISGLVAHRATLDPGALAADRAGAAARALFDPSKEATLARKYEAAAERGFFRALRDLEQARKAEARGESGPFATMPTMGSFSSPAPRPAPVPSPAPTAPVDRGSSFVPMTIGRPPA